MGSVFEVEDRFPGVYGNLRRAISNARLDEPHVSKLRMAVERLKLKHSCPEYQLGNVKEETVDVWCHVGIPSKKIAIFITDNKKTKWTQSVRTNWTAHGWRCLIITKENAEALPVEDISLALSKEIGGKK